MVGFRIEGNTSGNVAEVDVNNNLKVNLPTTIAQTGLAGIAAVNHDGASGQARLVRAAEISVNRRLRVGVDNLLFQDAFNYAALNTAVWNMALNTWTATYGVSGFTSIVGTTAAGNGVLRTWKYFPLYNGAGLSMEVDAIVVNPLQTGEVIEIGLGQALTNAAPTDGVFFRYTSGGALNGVVNYGGAETTITLSTPTTGVAHSYLLRTEQEETQFWVDNVLLGSIPTPVGQAGPAQSTYQPALIRMYAAGATTLAQTLKLGEIRVFLRDINTNRPWNLAMAGLGNMSSQIQSGAAISGSTALMINAVGVALTATANVATAPSGVFLGLGGNVLVIPSNALNTDGYIMGYQVPVGSAAVNGKSLVITGVKINGVVTTTALTGGPFIAVYSLAYGGTSGALSTAEAAGGASTTKAFRRVPLGMEVYGAAAAIGVQGSGVSMQFLSPIMVNQGEWVGVVVKNVGTLVTAGSVFYTVTFDAHWE